MSEKAQKYKKNNKLTNRPGREYIV